MSAPDPEGPILAIDVQYVGTPSSTVGYASGVLFDRFTSSAPSGVYTVTCRDVAPYEPGSFFKRELPPVLAVIAACPSPSPPRVVVVDGFVDLKPGRPGLGRHLFEERGGVVIGVAKNPFRDGRREGRRGDGHGDAEGEGEGKEAMREQSPSDAQRAGENATREQSPSDEDVHSSTPPHDAADQLPPGAILRGTSSRPLYVTAAGIEQQHAERLISSMHGKNRIPTMLKLADAEARRAAKAGG